MKTLHAITAAAVMALGAVVTLSSSPSLAAEESALVMPVVEGAGPILDPNAPFWKSAPALQVAMQPQTVATPNNAAPAINSLSVRSVHNKDHIALLIEWKDNTKSDRVVVDQFGDQVAVEFPIGMDPGAAPSPMMGNPGGRVNILQWRAALQHDMDSGDVTVAELYPYAHSDLYPDQVLAEFDAKAYKGALGVDNPLAGHHRSPVVDQMAEGFGTLTVKAYQNADGKGIYKDGMWHVVITTPMVTDNANSPRFVPGMDTVAAFAVWDGGNHEVGSRKSWSDWVPVKPAK